MGIIPKLPFVQRRLDFSNIHLLGSFSRCKRTDHLIQYCGFLSHASLERLPQISHHTWVTTIFILVTRIMPDDHWQTYQNIFPPSPSSQLPSWKIGFGLSFLFLPSLTPKVSTLSVTISTFLSLIHPS